MFRPRTLPFPEFMKQATEGTLPSATYTEKFDGFSWKIQCGKEGKNVYYTKNSKQPIEVPEERKPKNILEAIVLYIESHGPVLTPNDVLYAGEIPAWELNVEFTAYSLADGTMTDDLQLLYHKKCLDPVTGKLDETKFGFRINVFDAKFKEEGETEYRYWTRLESIRDSIHAVNPASNTYYATELYGADDLLQTLLHSEGVVCHRANGQVFKVKLPRYVMKARLLAVGDTTELDNFHGFNRFIFGVPRANGTWSVIHVSDMKELFTDFDRPKKGKAFIPPQSLKVKDDGLVVCEGRFALQGLMDALHRSASKAKKNPPTKAISDRKVIAAGNTMIAIGQNRNEEMRFKPEDVFLSDEVYVTLGCSGLWALKDDAEVHLQPCMIIGVEKGLYGPKECAEIDRCTPLETLLRIARDKPDPVEAYRMVGMRAGPFLGMEDAFIEKMTDSKFCTERI